MLDKYSNLVKTYFQSHSSLERARQGAFESFLNRDPETQKDKMSMAEIIAVYTDIILRKGGMKALSEVGKEDEHMKLIVSLFTHLVDKDLFIEVYRSYMGKRLLNEKSQSID
jgi:Cullin family